MPCGGITTHPKITTAPLGSGGDWVCFVCRKFGCAHFIEEWDAMIHARCAINQLADPDSDVAIIIGHGHSVHLDFSLESEKPE